MDDDMKRFALGIFFDGFGTLLLGVALFLDHTIAYKSLAQQLGIAVILFAVAIQWITAMYLIIPSGLRQWRER